MVFTQPSERESTGSVSTRAFQMLSAGNSGHEPIAGPMIGAWVSVGLALVSVGVGLQSLAVNVQPGLRLAACVVLVLGGTACSIQAWFSWARVETAMRERRPLPSSGMVTLLPILLGIVGVLIVLGLLIR